MPRPVKHTPQTLLVALLDAAETCAKVRGHATWLNGYRAGKQSFARPELEDEEDCLWEEERARWRAVADADAAFRRVAQQVIRQARQLPIQKRSKR